MIDVLRRACETLTRHAHCDAAWDIARNGLGPHAHGIHRTPDRRQYVGINLSAEDAMRLAVEYEAAPCSAPPSSPSS